MTGSVVDPARLPRRANTVIVGSLELTPDPQVRGAGQRVPVDAARGTLDGCGAPTASAVLTAAATALASRSSRR